MSEKFIFLSPEWEAAAQDLAKSHDISAPGDAEFSMNVTIEQSPFGDKLISIVAKDGSTNIERVHVQDADLFVKTNYETAYKLFLQGDINVVLSAMLEGKVVVNGDIAKLLSMANQQGTAMNIPFLEKLADQLKEITK